MVTLLNNKQTLEEQHAVEIENTQTSKSVFYFKAENGNIVQTLTTPYGSVFIDPQSGEYTYILDAESTMLETMLANELLSESEIPFLEKIPVYSLDIHGEEYCDYIEVALHSDVYSETDDTTDFDMGALFNESPLEYSGMLSFSEAFSDVSPMAVAEMEPLTYRFGPHPNDLLSPESHVASHVLQSTVETPYGTMSIDTGRYDSLNNTYSAAYTYTLAPETQTTPKLALGESVTQEFYVYINDQPALYEASHAHLEGEPIAVSVTIKGTQEGDPELSLNTAHDLFVDAATSLTVGSHAALFFEQDTDLTDDFGDIPLTSEDEHDYRQETTLRHSEQDLEQLALLHNEILELPLTEDEAAEHDLHSLFHDAPLSPTQTQESETFDTLFAQAETSTELTVIIPDSVVDIEKHHAEELARLLASEGNS